MSKFLRNRDIWSWLAVGFWMGLIFYLSHQPATESSELSQGFTAMIIRFLAFIIPVTIDLDHIHFLIRKGAHFFAYFVLGFLIMTALGSRLSSVAKRVLIAFAICLLYAISDEVHQLFIPGRSGEIRDVIIDSAGAIVGIGCYQLIIKISQWIKQKRSLKN